MDRGKNTQQPTTDARAETMYLYALHWRALSLGVVHNNYPGGQERRLHIPTYHVPRHKRNTQQPTGKAREEIGYPHASRMRWTMIPWC